MQPAPADYQGVLTVVLQSVEQLGAIGSPVYVCCPGLVNRDGSVAAALYSPVSGHSIRADLEAALLVPVVLWNDADAQAYGAFSSFSGTVIYLAIGTAVGGAIVTANSLVATRRNFSGEFGHLQLPGNTRVCPCGAIGCVDTLASGWSITRDLGSGWYYARTAETDARVFRAGEAIGQAANAMVSVIDPHLVAVNSRLVGHPAFVEGLTSAVGHRDPPLIVLSDDAWIFTCQWAIKLANGGGRR